MLCNGVLWLVYKQTATVRRVENAGFWGNGKETITLWFLSTEFYKTFSNFAIAGAEVNPPHFLWLVTGDRILVWRVLCRVRDIGDQYLSSAHYGSVTLTRRLSRSVHWNLDIIHRIYTQIIVAKEIARIEEFYVELEIGSLPPWPLFYHITPLAPYNPSYLRQIQLPRA